MESSAILQLHYLLFRIRRLGTFATTHLYFFFSSLYTSFSLDNTRCLLLVILLIYVVILLSIYCYKRHTHTRTTRYASWRLHFYFIAWADLIVIVYFLLSLFICLFNIRNEPFYFIKNVYGMIIGTINK